MTDAEIIKTAELCLNNSLLAENCEKCPCKEKDNYCMDVMLRNCIDLIRRQQAEIDQFADIGKMYSEIRSEAVREFAEKLKNMCDAPHWCVWLSEIDELVNEMFGNPEQVKGEDDEL